MSRTKLIEKPLSPNYLSIYASTNAPEILYKYRKWTNDYHKSILLESKIYLASPSKFEDPLDCNVPVIYPKKAELTNFFMVESKKKNPHFSRAEHRRWAKKKAKESPLANIEERAIFIEEKKVEYNASIGILSLTANNSNEALWNKYGDNHKGFCVGLDRDKLFHKLGGGGGITYYDQLPSIMFGKDPLDEQIEKNVYSKEKQWAFEEEYRCRKWFGYPATDSERNITMYDDCIVEVILGKDMKNTHKLEIRKIVALHHPNARIVDLKEK